VDFIDKLAFQILFVSFTYLHFLSAPITPISCSLKRHLQQYKEISGRHFRLILNFYLFNYIFIWKLFIMN